eukprot:CAMPEP_0172310606 /NCGR_PEP_ID=MMETSP1058-20130122/12015_1 /TAXON_ID=83371 /ORGANISM="Detonula confervacea, Strain CCMP 353" /LENGTH=1157 /DNA_ID=CAMNT_0013023473 /DNA_START=83 /DNA_END=3556 /DNA_ORIENTATION=-
MAATAQFSRLVSHSSSSSSNSNATAAANFDFSPAASSSIITDNTNFDYHTNTTTTDESHHADNECDLCQADADAQSTVSHFSDIAQAAANAMENVDMDKLCSELFSQEMLTQGMMEETVGVSAVELATMLATTTPAPAENAAAAVMGVSCINNKGAVTPTTTTGLVTDCASSTDGSEVPVPSTINVPSKFPATMMLAPRPSAPVMMHAQQPMAAARFMPMSVPLAPQAQSFLPQPSLQFSQSRNVADYGNPPQGKKQRSNSGGAAPPRVAQFFPSVGAPSVMMNMNNMNTIPQQATVIANKAVHPKAQPANQDEAMCVQCHFPGADVRIRCSSGCAYHARCIDLMAFCRDVNTDSPAHKANNKGGATTQQQVNTCPCCSTPSRGMEILPLSFAEMDRVQHSARAAFRNCDLVQKSSSLGANNKRSSHDMLSVLPTSIPSHAGAQPRRTVQCYDPSQPRTGRWTDEEILFRDTLISHFLRGSLPLSNGLKLNDFLPVMLKSKQSRLAKKMKHAKLSTKYFYPKGGCASTVDAAEELSRLEREFVASIPDAVERSEIKFHMGREWREHFANRCHSLRIAFDGTEWLSSVEDMERRLAFEKEKHRLVKRRFMMGKAMEKDGDALEQGVFVNRGQDGREEFELVVEKSVSNSARTAHASPIINSMGKDKAEASQSVWSSNEPNFKNAAPFLAGIASYIERNGVPFEHVDVWVPSYVENASTNEGSTPESNFRLCFGGSVTMGVQIVNNASNQETSNSSSTNPSSSDPSNSGGAMRRVPVIPEDKTNFSLFGDYSAKFSFSSGCGLPGRLFKSGIPTWEQFVSDAHPNLFERRGGAMQFGIKTAVGLPVDSPNVGRVVLVLYSKYDRCKDEKLVSRMMCDLKLLNPCPRWKLVVDVDTPSASGVSAGLGSSLQAPPPAVNARSSPATSTSTLTRGISGGSSIESVDPQANVPTHPTASTAAASNKDSQIKSLILLLASNIPSDMNSPLGQQLQGIMSLRLILLRGSLRSPEEEQLVDTLLVLYESYLHAGRSTQDIVVMLTRDFTFHLGHLGGLGMRYGCQNPPAQSPPSMYAAQAPAQPMPPMGGNSLSSPLMGPIMGSYNAPQVHQYPRSPPMMGTNPVMANCYAPQQQQQHPRTQSVSYLPRQNSVTSSIGSPRSTASR